MGNTLNNKKANGLALLPFLVFIVVYMGAGLVYQSKGVDMAFYQFPSVTAMFLPFWWPSLCSRAASTKSLIPSPRALPTWTF